VNTIEKSPMQCTTYWRCLGLFSSIPYHTIQQHGLQYTTQIVLSIALGIMLPDCHYFLYYGNLLYIQRAWFRFLPHVSKKCHLDSRLWLKA